MKGDTRDAAVLTWKSVKQFAAGGIPEVDGPVSAAAGQHLAGRVEGHSRDLAALPFECSTSAFEGTQQPAVSRVPERYGAVEATAGELA